MSCNLCFQTLQEMTSKQKRIRVISDSGYWCSGFPVILWTWKSSASSDLCCFKKQEGPDFQFFTKSVTDVRNEIFSGMKRCTIQQMCFLYSLSNINKWNGLVHERFILMSFCSVRKHEKMFLSDSKRQILRTVHLVAPNLACVLLRAQGSGWWNMMQFLKLCWRRKN